MKNLQINGVIGCDVMSKDIVAALAGFNNEDVTVELHSPGGSVFEGLAIFNALKSYQGKITMKIMGLAASMATIIAYAKGKPLAAKSSVFMIHNPSMIAWGDQRDLKKAAGICESLAKMMAGIYKDATGKKLTDIRQMMDDETYMYGKGICTEGFAASLFDDQNDDSEEDAKAMAELEIEDCNAKMKNFKETEDPQLVAMMNSFTVTESVAVIEPAKIPADAGNNIMEVAMTLKEFLAQNPAAQTEFNASITASKEAGIEEGKKQRDDLVAKVSAFIGKDSKYPEKIQALAKQVLSGSVIPQVLDYEVTAYDKLSEAQKSAMAKAEVEALIETPPDDQQNPSGELFAQVKTNDDFDAEVARTKALLGREVK